MRPPITTDFGAANGTVAITDDVAPPASVALLLEAIGWPEAAAITPYCGTAHQFDGLGDSGVYTRYLGVVTSCAVVHCRAAFSRGWVYGYNVAYDYHEAATSDGGMAGNDVVRVAWHLEKGTFGCPPFAFGGAHADIAVSSDYVNDAPAANKDRMFEVQTLARPYVEPWVVTKCAGFSVVPAELLDDLETL